MTENTSILRAAATMDPSTPVGTDLPSFLLVNAHERIKLWSEILKVYNSIFQSAPFLYRWALFGLLAGKTAMLPMVTMCVNTLETDQLLAPQIRRSLQSFVTCFFLGNFGIFDDIASSHLCFMKEGLVGLTTDPANPALLREAFTHLSVAQQERGLSWVSRMRAETAVVTGNQLLIDREQVEVLTPIFELFPDGLTFITATGSFQWPRIFRTQAKVRKYFRSGGFSFIFLPSC